MSALRRNRRGNMVTRIVMAESAVCIISWKWQWKDAILTGRASASIVRRGKQYQEVCRTQVKKLDYFMVLL